MTSQSGVAGEEDLKPLATSRCEFGALTVVPVDPWYSVPIDSEEPGIEGCQMIWEEGDQYMGFIRLVAFDNSLFADPEVKWEDHLVAFEASIMDSMNIRLGEMLWQNRSLPISGEGFHNAKAMALEARLAGVDHANEAHFVLFESDGHKYVISNLTPAESVSPDVYAANTGAMGRLMRALQPRK